MFGPKFPRLELIGQLIQFARINASDKCRRMGFESVGFGALGRRQTQALTEGLVDDDFKRALAHGRLLLEAIGDLRIDRESGAHADIVHQSNLMSRHQIW